MITDLIEEIYVSMSRNKLRIALTGFSIAWGIFMLIVLLGAGNGLLNGMTSNFASQAVNKIRIWPGYTSEEYQGMPKWRDIYLDITDVEYMRQQFPDIISSVQPSVSTSALISHKQEYINASMDGVYPGYINSQGDKVVSGRDINETDIREQRKVILMSAKSCEKIFGDTESHLGEWIEVQGIPFRIVGIYKSMNESRSDQTYTPITTAATIFKPDQHYSEMCFLVKNLDTKEANEEFNRSIRAALSRKKQFSDSDRSAIWLWNTYEDYLQIQTVMKGLRTFIWIIGLATLIAGITGISNIMLITVRERTHEFGIRKALGARPYQIVCLVLLESVAITIVFGYFGLFFGIGLTQLIDTILTTSAQQAEETSRTIFQHPTVDLGIVLMATCVMVIAGVIAGYIPAKRAVSIKPVEALAYA